MNKKGICLILGDGMTYYVVRLGDIVDGHSVSTGETTGPGDDCNQLPGFLLFHLKSQTIKERRPTRG
jgi:hypothetical protein